MTNHESLPLKDEFKAFLNFFFVRTTAGHELQISQHALGVMEAHRIYIMQNHRKATKTPVSFWFKLKFKSVIHS